MIRGHNRLLFVDTKKSPGFNAGSGLQLPSSGADVRGLGNTIHTGANLFKCRASQSDKPLFHSAYHGSQSGANAEQFPRSLNQTHANVLNEVMSKCMKSPDWENTHEAVTVPDALSRYGQEIQTAFGRNVRFVAPSEERFNICNGIYVPQNFKSDYAKKNLTAIAGH
jgi:hypothetical protein